MVEAGRVRRVGLVATNSIRGGANRKVLHRIKKSGDIFEAWSDEPWVIEGAAVRVSLICFCQHDSAPDHMMLDGKSVSEILADVTGVAKLGVNEHVDLTTAAVLPENLGVAFNGISKKGSFDIEGDIARRWLLAPLNPNGRPNSDVLSPWANGIDITRRNQDKWIINFGERTKEEAALYEMPFAHVNSTVGKERQESRAHHEKANWWLLARRAPGMFSTIVNLQRYMVTPEVSKYKFFVWLPVSVTPDKNLVVIASESDVVYGILNSRHHRCWALRKGTSLEDRPRYTSTTTFRTFAFPNDMTPNKPASKCAHDPRAKRIAEAARRLNELRENWLNPPDLVRREREVVPGFPDRLIPHGEKAARELKKRTLTNLYNARPQWLADAHNALDEAVAAAYGWPADLSEDEILARLLELSLARASKAPG